MAEQGELSLPPIEDDLSAEYRRGAAQIEFEQLRRDAESYATQHATEQPQQLSPGEAAQGAGVGIPFLKDLGQGTVELPLQTIGMVRDAAQGVLNSIDLMGNALGDVFGDPTPEAIKEMKVELPEVPEAESTTGQAARTLGTFLVGFIPAVRATRAISGGKAASSLGQFGQTEAAATLTGAVVFDGHEERLSDLIEAYPALSNPVTRYLKSDPNDSEAEGKFKTAIESLVVGGPAYPLMRGIQAIKANRISKGVTFDDKLGLPDEDVITRLGSTDKSAPIVKHIEGADTQKFLDSLSGDKSGKLPFEINWLKFSSEEDFAKAQKDIANVFTGQLDTTRRGVISDKGLRSLAGRLGMTPEELLKRRRGQAFNAEEILASRTLLDASTSKLLELANAAKGSTDETALWQFRKMLDVHVGIQAQVQGAASEAGRALRALQIPVGSREKQIAAITETLMKDGGPDGVRRLAEAVSSVDDPAAIAKAARGSWGKRITDSIIEWWYFSLLSGPATHVVNITSTGMNAVWQVPERYLAAQIGKIRPWGDASSVQAGEATELMYGYVNSVGDALRMSAKTFIREEQTDVFGKVEPRTNRAISAKNFGLDGEPGSIGWLMGKGLDGFGTVVRTPTRALMAEDEFFQTIGRGAQMRALAFRKAKQEGLEGKFLAERIQHLIENPTAMMKESSQDFARELTFTTPLGKIGQAGQNLMVKAPPLRLFLPFLRTPTNLFKWAGRRSPLAPLAASIRNDIKKGGPAGDLAMARMAMGTGVSMLAVDLAMRGLVTGGGPADPELRNVWRQTHQPYSVKVGDNWYSYNRGDPFGLLLGAAASFGELGGEMSPRDADELASMLTLAVSENVFNKTWLQGPAKAMEAFMRPQQYGERFLHEFAGTLLVPTGAAQVARNVDPVWREVNGFIDAIKARTPGYSQDLAARRNLWGQKILLEGGLGPDIISPIYKKGIEDRPIDDWLVANRVGLDHHPSTISGVELSPQQKERFAFLAGNGLKDPLTGLGLYDTLNAMVEGTHPNSATWETATDGPKGGRARIVKETISAFREMAKAQMLQEDNDFYNRYIAVKEEDQRALQETIPDPRAGELP